MAQVAFADALAGLVAGKTIARASWPAPNTVFLKLFAGRSDSDAMVVRVDGLKETASPTFAVADMLAADWIVSDPVVVAP